MKTIVLGLASVICGGIALMPLLVQPDAGSAPLATALEWLTTVSRRSAGQRLSAAVRARGLPPFLAM